MATDDFFRAHLDQMIDMAHPLAVLTRRMPWDEIEKALAPAFAHKDRAGREVEDANLFGTTMQLAGAGVSNRGRPRLPIRLMVALLYLKHDVSDEELVERWSENLVWQFFSGMAYYTPKLPCDATQIGRFRRVQINSLQEQFFSVEKINEQVHLSLGNGLCVDSKRQRWKFGCIYYGRGRANPGSVI